MSGEHRRLQSRGFVIHSPTEFQVTRPERYKVGEYINVRPVGGVRLIVQIDGDRITIAPALSSEAVRTAREIQTVTTYQALPGTNVMHYLVQPGASVMRRKASSPSEKNQRKPEPPPEPGERFIDLSEEE